MSIAVKGERNDCVSCGNKTGNGIIHKETKKFYGLCINCIDKDIYNKENFDVFYFSDSIRHLF